MGGAQSQPSAPMQAETVGAGQSEAPMLTGATESKAADNGADGIERRAPRRRKNNPDLRPHRCNDRLEDCIQALFEGNPLETLKKPAQLFWQCMKANPGEEPTEPFVYYKPDK